MKIFSELYERIVFELHFFFKKRKLLKSDPFVYEIPKIKETYEKQENNSKNN